METRRAGAREAILLVTHMSYTKDLYEKHHAESRGEGFSILKDERGACFSGLIGKGKRVLDIGCRDGALTKAFLEGNTVLGIDIDENALMRAAELGIATRTMDLMGDWQELQGQSFDVIVAGELLEHLFYPETIVAKVREHLTPGGQFIGSVPNAFSLKNRLRYASGSRRNTPLADPTHINQFSAKELKSMLQEYFSQVEIRGLGRYQKLASLSPNWFAFDLVFVAHT